MNQPSNTGVRKRKCSAAVLAAISLLAAAQVRAQDEQVLSSSVVELQNEVKRLRQLLQQQAGAQDGAAQVADAPVASPAAGDTGAADASVQTLDQFVVHSRNREEKLLEVPIPVSAISGQALERYNAVTIQDFANLTPNLLVNAPNARQQSISLRGIGKNTSGNAMSNDSLEPSVSVIVDGVPSAYITQAWGDFADLDHVEVLRGPQGTLLGKNSTMGVINVITKAPSFTPSTSAELTTGLEKHGALGGKFSTTGPLQDGVLAYRASLSVSDFPGPFENQAALHSNVTFQEKKRLGARLQFLWLPSASVTARISFERQESSELTLWGEPPLIGDPTTFPNGAVRPTTYSSRLARPYFGGYQPLIGNWDTVDNNGAQPYRNSSNGATANVDWSLHGALEGFVVTSISAYRDSLFEAKNDSDWTHFDIGQGGAAATQKQVSQEVRISSPVGKDKPVDYTAGVYLLKSQVSSNSRSLSGADAGAFNATNAQYATLSATPAGRLLMTDSLRSQFVNSATHPETTSNALFTQGNWHIGDKTTLTLGLRRTTEKRSIDYSKWIETDSPLLANIAANAYAGASAAQLDAAKGIRLAQIAGLGSAAAQTLDATSYGWLVNPSYQLRDNVLLYASAGKGEKSGTVQINTSTFAPFVVAPEKVFDYELGVKGEFYNRSLVLSGNLYNTRVTDYQQTLTEVDPVATAAKGVTTYRSFLGNAPGVILRGIEADGSWAPHKQARLTFGGAYNHAVYSDFRNAPCPGEISSQPGGAQQCDFTGKQIPFSPRWTANLGIDLNTPISANYVLRAFANSAFRSSANWSAGLSQYGQFGSYTLVDGGFGVETRDGNWSLSLVAKNLGDVHYVTNVSVFSTSNAITATPGGRRSVGLTLRARKF
jgi:iron complex outermembrane receptor protein